MVKGDIMTIEKERIITHSSIKEYENDGDDQDRYYLPWRAAVEVAARMKLGEQVRLIIPRHEEFEEYIELLEQELLQGRKIARMYTSDKNYLMDEDIKLELLDELNRICGKNMIIHPYQATDEFYAWASVLQERGTVQIFSDKKERKNPFWWGHKGAYHRWINDLLTHSLSERYHLPFPRGFIACSRQELEKAVSLLETTGVVLKPIFGAGGFQIGFCSNIDDILSYEWPIDPLTNKEMPIAVQEKLKISRDDSGERLFSMQFNKLKLFGRLTRQRMDSTEWCGNEIPAGVPTQFEEECYKYTRKLINLVKPKGSGGIDFADVNGRPVILEVNGGRPTGVHVPKYFKEAFVSNARHFIFEKVSVGNYTAHEVWDILRSKSISGSRPLALQKETPVGIFPIVWLKGSWGMLASFGDTYEEADRQLKTARETLGL